MTGLNSTPTARDMGYQGVVHTLVQRITYAQENTIVDVTAGKLPAGASVIGGGVHVVTAFADTGTDTLDVGFRDGSSTDDPDAYATLLTVSAVGYIALDELAATTNIRQTKDAIVTWRYNGQNNDAAAGEAYLIINYVVPSSP
ncbi:MAG: hypothetical protein LLG15_07690 [Betaproteobacteria bacterium]|nr:hypothetical protein [Betaproteobacteria bacterium]